MRWKSPGSLLDDRVPKQKGTLKSYSRLKIQFYPQQIAYKRFYMLMYSTKCADRYLKVYQNLTTESAWFSRWSPIWRWIPNFVVHPRHMIWGAHLYEFTHPELKYYIKNIRNVIFIQNIGQHYNIYKYSWSQSSSQKDSLN